MKPLSAHLSRTAVAMLGGAVIATVISAAVPSTTSEAAAAQSAQNTPGGRPAPPPVPCGPQGQLPATLSKNVDGKSRCFELRIYTVDASRVGTGNFKGGINELHQRFREKEVAIFQKHGAEILGVWQQMDNPNTLVWMLAYRDRAHRDDVWAKFGADPEWTALRTKYPVPVSASTFMMSAADYSPMK
ncbi:MAG: hypothetical protein FJW27_06690 [Acidimicrobiia bacterium]|nr:hypothetical protein [Acidimicrobiia bacterium]